jgi:hypothetical protein
MQKNVEKGKQFIPLQNTVDDIIDITSGYKIPMKQAWSQLHHTPY